MQTRRIKRHTLSKQCATAATTDAIDECEIELINKNIDDITTEEAPKIVQSVAIKQIYAILVDFIRKRKLVCYGGSAINAILPKSAKFYDTTTTLPDYDVFSTAAIQDAKDLVDIYAKHGFDDVEARSGMHMGTYKVFVNFAGVLDLTEVPVDMFNSLQTNAVIVDKVHYAPPLYLRMAIHRELSRPLGDISRWEKVASRLQLLDHYFPYPSEKSMASPDIPSLRDSKTKTLTHDDNNDERVYNLIFQTLLNNKCIFFGTHALSVYSGEQPLLTGGEFDVSTEEPGTVAKELRKKLNAIVIKPKLDIVITEHPAIGEIVPEHVVVKINGQIVATLYRPYECYNYNETTIRIQSASSIQKQYKMRLATTDTVQSLLLAFSYVGTLKYDKEQLRRTAARIDALANKHRLEQTGIWRRFGLPCYGNQSTLESIRAKKAEMFIRLKGKRKSKEYERWFLRYTPNSRNASKSKNKILDIIGFNKTAKRKTSKLGKLTKRISQTRTI
jgi:hypothetical protein